MSESINKETERRHPVSIQYGDEGGGGGVRLRIKGRYRCASGKPWQGKISPKNLMLAQNMPKNLMTGQVFMN